MPLFLTLFADPSSGGGVGGLPWPGGAGCRVGEGQAGDGLGAGDWWAAAPHLLCGPDGLGHPGGTHQAGHPRRPAGRPGYWGLRGVVGAGGRREGERGAGVGKLAFGRENEGKREEERGSGGWLVMSMWQREWGKKERDGWTEGCRASLWYALI